MTISNVKAATPRRARRSLGARMSSLALATMVVSWTGAAHAQDADIDKIAHYSGADRQEFLEAGARNEKSLTVFSSTGNPAIANIVEAFTKKYPYLDVQVPCCLNSPSNVITRGLAEFQSGRSNIGVVETFVSGVNVLRSADLLTTFTTPNSSLHIEQSTDPDGYYVVTRSAQRGLAVNTKAVPLSEVPKTWDELLDPKWKGRIAVAGGEAATGLIAYFQDNLPPDYLNKFAAQEPRLIEVTARALAEMLIAGEVEISPTITRAHISKAIKDGAPVAFTPIEPVLSISTGVALPKSSPSPHAAMLFIDFVTSPEGQKIFQDAGYELLSKGFMSEEDAKRKLVFPESDPNYPQRTNELTELMDETFH